MEEIDTLVIGAGIVGLAIARALALEGREVIVAERENLFGSVTSARNSGVIHAGIYYPKGSLKARLCVAGKEHLYRYAKDRKIPYNNCGKLIVACDNDDLKKLSAIQEKASQNGVNDLNFISAKDAKHQEPELECVGALVSPSTGIIDIHRLMEEFIIDIENHGGIIAHDNEIQSIEIIDQGAKVSLSSGDIIQAKTLINAAGHGAQTIARNTKGLPQDTIPPQYYAKGNYFSTSGQSPFSQLIYPVPVSGGLGAHFTMNMAGESLFGPDVEWIEKATVTDYSVDPSRDQSFYNSIKRFYPGITEKILNPSYAGIRPKLVPAGHPDADFTIHGPAEHGVRNLVNLYGIESPGLTASMAIAAYVKDMLKGT